MGRIFFTENELSFTPEEAEQARQEYLAREAAKSPEQKAREAQSARNVYAANEGYRRRRYLEYLREAAKMDYPRRGVSAWDSHAPTYPTQREWDRYNRKVNELREQYIRGSAFVNPDAPDAVYEPDEGLTDMLNEAGFEEDDVRVPFLLGRGYNIPTKEAAARYFGEPMTEKEFKKFKEKYGK